MPRFKILSGQAVAKLKDNKKIDMVISLSPGIQTLKKLTIDELTIELSKYRGTQTIFVYLMIDNSNQKRVKTSIRSLISNMNRFIEGGMYAVVLANQNYDNKITVPPKGLTKVIKQAKTLATTNKGFGTETKPYMIKKPLKAKPVKRINLRNRDKQE